MRVSRRAFFHNSATAAGTAVLCPTLLAAQRRGDDNSGENSIPDSIKTLKSLPNPAPPISDGERRSRIAKAQRLMNEQGISAIVLESGTSMAYFTNVRWGLSERPFLLFMPAKGELAWISPGFEEARARELIKFSNDVRV